MDILRTVTSQRKVVFGALESSQMSECISLFSSLYNNMKHGRRRLKPHDNDDALDADRSSKRIFPLLPTFWGFIRHIPADGNAPDSHLTSCNISRVFHKKMCSTVGWKHSKHPPPLITAKNHIMKDDSTTLSMKMRETTPCNPLTYRTPRKCVCKCVGSVR